MNKKTKNLIILVSLLVVAIGSYVGITIFNENQEEKEASIQSMEEEANRIVITDMDNVVEVSYNNGTDELSFIKNDDTWYYKEDENFPLEQSYVTELANAAGQLNGIRKLENGDALSDYGLDTPSAIIILKDENGNETTLNIGNSVNEDYYLYVTGDESIVYTVSSTLLSKIDYSLYDLVQLEEIPTISASTVESISIVEDSKDIELKKTIEVVPVATSEEESLEDTQTTDGSTEDVETNTEETSTEAETTEQTVWTKIENGVSEDVTDSTFISNITSNLSSLAFDSCINYKGTIEQLEAFGLNSLSKEIRITYMNEEVEESLVLHIGNVDDSGEYYYATMNDSTAINFIDKDIIDVFFDLDSNSNNEK